MVLADKKYRVIGTRPVRPDGVDKVTGRALYGADVRPAGMLHGKVLRSPHAHARIKSIDTSKALALPGVLAVITAADVPDQGTAPIPTLRGPIPPSFQIDHLIANETVLYGGQAVAAVAASDAYIAADALDLIEVEYEVLKPVMSIDQAISPDAPILHDPALTEEIDGLFNPIDGRPTNIARQVKLELGDLEAGFAAADVVVEREYSTSTAHQGYIEPHTATALWNQDGQLTVWTPTQGAFGVRGTLAGILKHPVSKNPRRPHRDRRRLRRQALLLPLAARGAPIEEDRPPRPALDDPQRSLRGLRTHLRYPLASEARRHPRRQDRRC